MAFVYESIKEEDKSWVDFSRFKGLRNNKAFEVYSFSMWTVDREKDMALTAIDCGGRLGEDDYELWAFGFYYQGKYISFTVRYQEINKAENSYTERWYLPYFWFDDETEEQRIEIIKVIREALIAFIHRNLSKQNYLIEF
jgi:hypothetical protein